MTVWTSVNQNERYAIAIHNFAAGDATPGRLDINVGELLEIAYVGGDWYRGRRLARNPDEWGLFPKSYVCIKDCIVDRTGSEEIVSLVHSPIVKEITFTLRDWGVHWKTIYVNRGDQFKFIELSMRALLELRSAILSGTLPVDQLKKEERTAIYTIDKGNRALGMDLAVRSTITGRKIDPEEVSTCQLYNLHLETSNKIKQSDRNSSQMSTSSASLSYNTTSYSFFASVRNFVCKMTEDAELLMSLYDGITHEHFTENYVVKWSKGGLATDIDQLHNLRVLFTDLGVSDIKREKVYLVCFVVRIGGMEASTIEARRSSVSSALSSGRAISQFGGHFNQNGDLNGTTRSSGVMRRPFGVAAMDVTHMLSGQVEVDDDKHYCVTFFPCEKDNLDSLLRKIISNKDLKPDTKTGQGLWISVKLLHGDMKQIREEVPHLVVSNVSIARKMGFPEVILPGDARNDLYMTIVSGCFTRGGGKSTDRNIEVTVRVCNKYGQAIPGVISLGGGVQPLDEYNSVVYYHEDRPRWHEIFKICVPIEEFKEAHVVFLFKHRSSNEAKDKSEKPFGLAYTQLMQPNGTTLVDTSHTLCVYKVDPKKWPSNEMEAASCYLTLPSLRSNPQNGEKEKDKVQKGFLSLVQKDSFIISTNVCSTKLTQNVELLGVLNWGSRYSDGTLRTALETLRTVPGSDIVKFLQDILDALFNILTKVESERGVDYPGQTGDYDDLVFECLIYMIMLVSDRKYHHFQAVLDLYIKESFCATLVYKKLIRLLSALVLDAGKGDNETLLRSMKCLEYLVRFIVRSRQLHMELTHDADQHEFYEEFQGLLESMVTMMQCSSDSSLTSQGACIKYLPTTASHIITVFPAAQLSKMIGEILDVLPLGRLTKQRLMAVLDIVQGPLFLTTQCRCILLPHITMTLKTLIQNHDETNRCGVEMRSKNRSVDKIARVLGASRRKLQEHRGYSEQLELCIRILGEILTLIFKMDPNSTSEELKHLHRSLLRTIIQAFTQMDRENPIACYLASVLLEMLRQMNIEHYSQYVSHFLTRPDLLDFLTEIQAVLKDLVEKPVFHSHWADMINLQNCIILKTLRLFSTTLVDTFLEPLERHVWSNWFRLAIAFLTQPSLQLENLSPNQKRRLASKYGDMRCEGAFVIRNMWFNLGQHKMLFVPALVGPFLEMSLIPETELRKATIPLFFDMMQCEFNSSKYLPESYGETKKDLSQIKGNFSDFENEMIHKLDVLVEGGKGDAQWRSLFVSLVCKQCASHPTLKDPGCRFVAIIGRLLDTLLLYRELHDHASIDHRMQATTTLLDFYSEIDRPEMYIRYVNKLCGLHAQVENWTEAGLTLKLHSKLLAWASKPLASRLRSPQHPIAASHRHLKEALYIDIINYLDKGKMWELAIDTCSELVSVLVSESAYEALSILHLRLSKLYNALRAPRARPEYFRVGYFGQGFPEFLRNRVFIYRGKEYERLEDFCSRTLNGFPQAELMSKLTPPDHEILNSPSQFIQINAVEPIMIDKDNKLSNRPLSDQIMQYHKYNNVKKFRYSRPIRRQDESTENAEGGQNEFASLWLERTEMEISDSLPGILRWFPVIHSRTYEMSPLQVAVETMTDANNVLKYLVLEHKGDDTLPLDPLTRKLNGMVDAAVMGGIVNYEKAFFTDDYQKSHPEHKNLLAELKDLIATQIPLLELGIEVHRARMPITIAPLHERIVECFEKMRAHVHTNYGKKLCDLEKEISMVTMRRQISSLTNGDLDMNGSMDHRWSEISTHTNSSDSGIGSRPQTNTLKAFTSQFNKQANRGSLGSSSALGSLSGLGSFGTGGRSILNMSPAPSPARKRDKEKRRNHRKSETSSASVGTPPVSSSSQWYTTKEPPLVGGSGSMSARQSSISNDIPSITTVFELRQELTPSRPLRSEAEKERRLSQRPQSLQSGTNSNRNSAGTTDSNLSMEDDPPPLPQKTVKSEAINTELTAFLPGLPSDSPAPPQNIIISSSLQPNGATSSPILKRQDYDTVISPRGSFLYSSLQTGSALLSKVNLSILKEKAPTPPPKKKHSAPNS